MTKPNKPPRPEKKKHFEMMDPVRDFLRDLSGDIKQELNSLIWMLEQDGYLEYPYGEKIGGDDDLFAIRVIQTGNIRVFYVYGLDDAIYGIHAYEKKTEKIPRKELKRARTVLKILTEGGLI